MIEEERFEVEDSELRKKVSNDVGTIGTKMCIYDHFFLSWTDVSALK